MSTQSAESGLEGAPGGAQGVLGGQVVETSATDQDGVSVGQVVQAGATDQEGAVDSGLPHDQGCGAPSWLCTNLHSVEGWGLVACEVLEDFEEEEWDEPGLYC